MTALLRERRRAEEGLAGPWWNEEKGGKDEPEVGTNVEKDAILTRVVHKFGAECWVAMETWRGQVRTRGVKALHPNIEKRAWTRTRPWPTWKRGRRER
ncbi:MAG: hypothetical protein ACPIOQ_00385 [Promethearchaeia archaeon]